MSDRGTDNRRGASDGAAVITQHCAICGQVIHPGAAAVPIKGVFGEGVRHADYAICMDAARKGGDPYA